MLSRAELPCEAEDVAGRSAGRAVREAMADMSGTGSEKRLLSLAAGASRGRAGRAAGSAMAKRLSRLGLGESGEGRGTESAAVLVVSEAASVSVAAAGRAGSEAAADKAWCGWRAGYASWGCAGKVSESVDGSA
jgi:hypothetical protein